MQREKSASECQFETFGNRIFCLHSNFFCSFSRRAVPLNYAALILAECKQIPIDRMIFRAICIINQCTSVWHNISPCLNINVAYLPDKTLDEMVHTKQTGIAQSQIGLDWWQNIHWLHFWFCQQVCDTTTRYGACG